MSPWGEGWAGVFNVPGTCVWTMMLRYKHVVLELASCHQGVFVRNIHDHMDAGTQVLDRSWLELKHFLGNNLQSVSKSQATEGLIRLCLTLSFNLSTDSP